ncbi:2TM domain-containing protein, partial [Flavobacteriaceae bacterium]|nr:2TM domain-containing protein [Flavobacteriaceae bacterium]
MEKEFLKEQQYLNAKKRVKEIKGFYSHLVIYMIINIFISGIIIFGLTYSDN